MPASIEKFIKASCLSDFSYYAHYVAIIYIMHIISLLYGYVGNVLFVLLCAHPELQHRRVDEECW